MDSVWGLVGIVVFVCGIYAIYSFARMRSTGAISAALLLGKDYMYKKCKNKEAYIQKAGPALLVFGIAALASGALDIVHCYVYRMPAADTIGMLLFFVVLVWFAVYTTKLKKEYF